MPHSRQHGRGRVKTDAGVTVYLDRFAAAADAIIAVNGSKRIPIARTGIGLAKSLPLARVNTRRH